MNLPSEIQQQLAVTPTADMEQLRSLLTTIIRSLIDKPELLGVEVENRDGALLLRVRAADEDIGRIIGSQGRTVRSIRTCLLAAATKKGLRCILEVLESPPQPQPPLLERAGAFYS